MKFKLTRIAFLLIFTVLSCKKEPNFSDYKYADKPLVFNCEGVNNKLLNEALYSFELEKIVSKHTLDVFNALKSENDLWDANNIKSRLNYSGAVMNCISNGIQDKSLKTTLDALMSTNSMSPKLFGSPLTNKYRNALNDKNLAMYIALDLYYAKMFNVDFSQVNFDNSGQKVDFNHLPPQTEVDPHAGHNH
jgi:hypothetical protein